MNFLALLALILAAHRQQAMVLRNQKEAYSRRSTPAVLKGVGSTGQGTTNLGKAHSRVTYKRVFGNVSVHTCIWHCLSNASHRTQALPRAGGGRCRVLDAVLVRCSAKPGDAHLSNCDEARLAAGAQD
jgi:hypothetical protein